MPDKTIMQVQWMTPKAMLMNGLYFPLIAFLNQYHQQLLILALFMTIDFFFGLAKSYKIKKHFQIAKAWSGIITKMVTMMIPFLLNFFAIGTGVFDTNLTAILPYGFSALIVIEMYSILGNFYTIRTGKEMEDKDLLSFLVLKIRKFFEAWITAFKG